MSSLERAIVIAAEGHAGATDKGGAPYILHPLRMMLTLTSDEERIVAVLHDVCEDCPGWTLERLKSEGFSQSVITALDSVTKRTGEHYDDFARRAAANSIGRKVKLADLIDNCDLSRIATPTDADHQRVAKYQRAIEMIAIGDRRVSVWKMDGSVCPTCEGAGRNSERYPGAVCEGCELVAIDRTGTAVKLYNESMSGGLMIVAGTRTVTGAIAEDEALYIRGVECRAKEHRFGGVVIQPTDAWSD